MNEKQVKYILNNFEKGTTILFMGVYQYNNLEQLTEAGFTCILLGKDQDYWRYIENARRNMIIYVDNTDKVVNCYAIFHTIFVYDKNRVINSVGKDIRVWAEVLKESE